MRTNVVYKNDFEKNLLNLIILLKFSKNTIFSKITNIKKLINEINNF